MTHPQAYIFIGGLLSILGNITAARVNDSVFPTFAGAMADVWMLVGVFLILSGGVAEIRARWLDRVLNRQQS